MKKLKVTPEGRKGIYNVSKAEIIDFLADYSDIHNITPSGNMMTGADWSKDSVIETINKSESLAILTGGHLRYNLGHALSVIVNNKLLMFDIGEMKESGLIVI